MKEYAAERAVVPQLLMSRGNSRIDNCLIVVGGAVLLAILAQISIPLPFTPVPITGQTFGAALVALIWGRKRALATFSLYLFMGGMGLPVFSLGRSGLLFGPTTGYLIGMLVASYVMGMLADRGWTQSFWKSWAASYIGSIITFGFGLFVLSFFLPISKIWIAGLFPFLPGDFIKTLLAATLAYQLTSKRRAV